MSEAIGQEMKQLRRGHLAKLKVNMLEHAAWRGANRPEPPESDSCEHHARAPLSSNSAESVEPAHGDSAPGRNA
jgi:hypothetical protein